MYNVRGHYGFAQIRPDKSACGTLSQEQYSRGELNKLAHNVTFGHGIHAGIHWRSDSDQSMILGEALAISVLQDMAQCYNEKFTISFAKLDGTTATISNQ